MTRYLERTAIARALKARTWQSRAGETGGNENPSGHQYRALDHRYAPGAAQTPATGPAPSP